MEKVLLASMRAGGGHHALRDSFQAALTSRPQDDARWEAVSWDSADRLINWFYSLCVHHLPRFQGRIYEVSSRPWASAVLAALSPGLLLECVAALRREVPDLVISTHPLLTMMLVKAKHLLELDLRVVAAIPDYGTPTSAFNPPQRTLRPDALVVMAEDTLHHYLNEERLPASRVHLSGFLTRAPFEAVGRARLDPPADRRAERSRLLEALSPTYPALATFDPARPTVLFTGGSAWTEKTLPVLELLLGSPAAAGAMNLIVVCGRHERFRRRLSARFGRRQLAVLGHVPPWDYALLMGLADVPVLASLAPASMQELLETRCGPLLLYSFIPGTEAPHAAYIEAERIGLYEPDAAKMVRVLQEAVGLRARSSRVATVAEGFAGRALALRAQSVARARGLGELVNQLLREGTERRQSAVA